MKKLLCSILAIVLMFGMVSCTSKEATPKEATEILVNALVYKKAEDINKYKNVFNQDATEIKKQSEQDFTSGFISVSSLNVSEEDAKQLMDTLNEQIKDKTSYKVEVVKEDKKNPELEIKVKGLDFDKIKPALQTKIKEAIKEDPSLVKDEDETAKFIMDTLESVIKETDVVDEEISVPVKLEPFSKNKSKWQIVDETKTIKSITNAFYGKIK